MIHNSKITSNKFFRILIVFLLVVSLLSSNPFLSFLSIILFALILVFYWQPGLPFVLGFILLWQWLQVSIKVFYADILDLDVSDISKTGSSFEAILLSLIGLFILGAGIYVITSRIKPFKLDTLKVEALKYSTKKLFSIYLAFSIINVVLQSLLFNYPAVTQILVGLMNLKTIFILLLFFATLLTNENKSKLFLIIFIEVVLGFSGFFSGFKQFSFYY